MINSLLLDIFRFFCLFLLLFLGLESDCHRPVIYQVHFHFLSKSPCLNFIFLVDFSHISYKVLIEQSGFLPWHCVVEIRLIAFQYAVESKLTHYYHFII